MDQLLARLSSVSGLKSEDIWVYLQDIPAQQMIEFGRFLPAPGQESEWQKGFSAAKKRALL